MSSEFVARKGLIIKSVTTGSTENRVLVQDNSDLVKIKPMIDFVTNDTDTFTGTPDVIHIVSCSAAEYAGIGAKDPNTLYIIIG
jgi:hypothetical protein